MSDDPARLDQQLCFALYSASRAATGEYREGLGALGLTYTQYVTLLVLWEHDGIAVSELGARLHLDSGTLSPLLKRMASAGLVDRRRDDADERRVTIHLTESGQALRSPVAEVQRDLYRSLSMTPDELDVLRRLAQRFADHPTTPTTNENS